MVWKQTVTVKPTNLLPRCGTTACQSCCQTCSLLHFQTMVRGCWCFLATRANNVRVTTTVGVVSIKFWNFSVVLYGGRGGARQTKEARENAYTAVAKRPLGLCLVTLKKLFEMSFVAIRCTIIATKFVALWYLPVASVQKKIAILWLHEARTL